MEFDSAYGSTFSEPRVRALFVWPWKMVSVRVRHLFYKPMDKKIKPWTLRFSAKENPNMEKSLFDWPVVLQYDVKAKYRLISRKFSGMKFFSKATRVCIRSIKQSNRSISVRLLFLFSLRVFLLKVKRKSLFLPLKSMATSTRIRTSGGSRGRVQEVRTLPEMTCGFLIQLVFCQKKNYVVYWCWSRARDECTSS